MNRIWRSLLGVFLCVSIVTLASQEGKTQESQLDQRINREWASSVKPLMQKHCGDCHMQGNNEGGVNLEDYHSLAKIREHESTWEQVRGVIRADAMPPPEESKMNLADKLTISNWIQSALHEVDCGCAEPPPQVTLRRLNQVEYDNTIRDLFQVAIRPSKEMGFVSDDVGNGFDNQGEVLTMPPIMLEKYMQAATHIAEHSIESDREKYRKQFFEGEALTYQNTFGVSMRASEGDYVLQVRLRFGDKQPDTCQARLILDGQEIALYEVPSRDETYKLEVNLASGSHQLSIEYVDDQDASKRGDAARRLFIDSVRLTGPKKGLPAYPIHHETLVIATPDQLDATDGKRIGAS